MNLKGIPSINQGKWRYLNFGSMLSQVEQKFNF